MEISEIKNKFGCGYKEAIIKEGQSNVNRS
jgi:hypothetical protein